MYKDHIILSRFDEIVATFKTIIIGLIIIYVLTFDNNSPINISRLFLFVYGLLFFIITGFSRISIISLQRELRRKQVGLMKSIIIGFNQRAIKLYSQFNRDLVWGFNIVGFVDNKKSNSIKHEYNILGNLSELANIIESRDIKSILIVPDEANKDELLKIISVCTGYRVRLMLVATHYEMVVGLLKAVEIHGLPMLEILPHVLPISIRCIKRIIDITISCFLIIILIIITPIIVCIIRMESVGPPFYIQQRVGKNGRIFKLIKYRSMISGAEDKTGEIWAKRNDPRITKVGKILRRLYIDELPQFINVLLGQMSIVGPRPERPYFVQQFIKDISLYERRLIVRPGITGWAQIRHKYDESIEDVMEKTSYDLFYIDHISIKLDLKIIASTIMKVLRGEGH